MVSDRLVSFLMGGPLPRVRYVHSKIMIIDCTALIGSANINNRNLLGSRDSEIGLLIEDKELVASFMGGKPWIDGKFALCLRLALWSEHLGLQSGHVWITYTRRYNVDAFNTLELGDGVLLCTIFCK